MNKLTVYADDETLRMMAKLAEWWGLPQARYNTPLLARLTERAYQREAARRELAEFDEAQRGEPDPLA